MASMLDHFLNPMAGPWNPHSHYSFRAKVAAAILENGDLVSGRVAHLDLEGGELVFKTGVHDTGVAMFMFPFSAKAEAQDGSGTSTATDPHAYTGFGTDGIAVALTAVSGYELMSSEYVDGAYPPNTPLTAQNDDEDDAVGGLLEEGDVYVDAICGVVSQGLVANPYGVGTEGLCFFAVWLPKLTDETITAINA
jgi:hypothetical protein